MQEELKDYQVNPDIPTMRLYKCWDSSAVISEDEQSRSTNVAREGVTPSWNQKLVAANVSRPYHKTIVPFII